MKKKIIIFILMIFIGMPLPLFAVDDGNEYFFTNQNVGIKTRTPQASLDVNGDIQSLEIRTNNFRLDRPNAKNGMVLTLGLNGYAEWISFPVQPPTDGPDNLGNHVAEQDLQMSNKNIIDVNTISASKFNGGNFYGGRFNGDGSELKNVPSDIFIVKDNVISNNGSSSNYQNNFVIGAPHIATNDANFHTRMIFNKEKGYFRAGRAEDGEWDQGGYYSVAFGKNTISSADYSFSFGLNSQATGVGAFAGGNGSSASSNYSFAFGNNTLASGNNSIALGANTLASGNNSIALGKQSIATKDSAIAFGVSNNADGVNSIALGNSAKASQTNSIAIGTNVLSLANYGFTIGSGANEQTPLINSIDNSLAIGFLSNQSTLFVGPSTGATTVGKVGIGTNIPQTLLDIAGKTTTEELRLTNGAQQGYVLTSIDAMGNATWKNLQEIELNQQGDNLGNHIAETDLNFNGFNLVNGNEVNINKIILQENGNEANPIVTFADALTTGIYQGPEKQIAFSANGTQALVINQAGKIGVNYKNPFTELYINGNTFTEKLWANNGDPIAPSITFITDRNTGFFNPSNNNLAITTKGVEKIRIDGNGAMGIGFKNMQTKLDINGSIMIKDGTQGEGKVLTSDANGIARWELASQGSAGDNLGDHIATQDLDMATKNIVNVEKISANTLEGNLLNSTVTGGIINGSELKNVELKPQQLFALADNTKEVLAANSSETGSYVRLRIPSAVGWSEFSINDETNKQKWAIGSLGDQRPDNNGGKNTFYIFQRSNKDDINVNGYRLAITDTGNVGIGTTKATEKLHIKDGSIKIQDGTQADGYVLTSDATGKGTWKSLAELSTNGDNLGDHLATQDLDMANNSIANISSLTTSSLILNDGSQTDGFVLTTDASGTARWTDPNSLSGDVTQLKNGNKVASLVETNGNFYVTNNGESNIVAKGFVVSTSNNILRRGNVPWTGASTKDGYRIKYSTNITGEANDFLVFEKLDGNAINPDGGIAFTNTGNDGIEEIALAIRGQGNIGIGTATPTEKLHIKDGSIKIQDGTQADGYVLTSDATGKGTWKSLAELSTNGDNLGDHIATQDLDMATKSIVNVEKISANTLEGNLLNSTVTGGVINGSELKNVELKPQQLFALADNTKEVLAANSSETGSYVRLRIPSAVGWSEFSINDETNKQKWAIGSLGDQRPDNNGGKNTFYIFQRSNKDDINVNGYRLAITDTGNVGIGTTQATEKLHIKDGSIKIQDGTQANGYVLTSDATGKGTWKSLAELSTNGDNLGDHIATQDLDMATKNILNVEKISANTLEGNSLNSSIFAYKILNNTVNGTLELQSGASFVGDINLNGNLHFAKGGFSVGLSNRNVSWRPSGTVIEDTGWIDFIADSNNNNDNIGFRFWSNYPLYITKYDVNNDGVINGQDPQTIINCLATDGGCDDLKYDVNESGSVTSLDSLVIINYLARRNNSQIAAILENGVEINKPLKVEGGHLTLQDGTQGEGKILSSVTKNGLASWIDPNEIFPGQWKLVHFQDFEANDANSGWKTNAGASVNLTSCNNTKILGGVNSLSNSNIKKTFSLSGIPHNQVMIKFNYYSLDSWDDEDAVAYINNTNVWSKNLIHHARPWDRSPTKNNRSLPNCDTGGSFTTGALSSDRVFSASGFINHNSGTLEIEFGSSLNEAPNNESYGIDNLEIYVRTVDKSVRLPEVPYTPPPARYYQANVQNCTSWCTNQGMTNVADPEGFYCAAGEAKSLTAINQKNEGKFSFTYGCWSDRGCTSGRSTGGGTSVGAYCYGSGQKRDNDRTDRTVACYCQAN